MFKQPLYKKNQAAVRPRRSASTKKTMVAKNKHSLRNWLLFWLCLLAFTSSLTLSTAFGLNGQTSPSSAKKEVGAQTVQTTSAASPEPGPSDKAEAEELSRQLKLTPAGKAIFTANKPLFFKDREVKAFPCDRLLKTMTYGCWHKERIYILEHPAKASTTAHELLHAVFYNDLFDDETQDISVEFKADLEAVYEANKEFLEPIIKAYEEPYAQYSQDLQELLIYNELHSYIGTMISDIPPRLEEHYAQYFKNRQEIVDLPQLHESFI